MISGMAVSAVGFDSVTDPSRRTVIVSQTGQHLLEVVRDVDDRDARGARGWPGPPKRTSISAWDSEAVGSSRMRMRRRLGDRLGDLDELLRPDREAGHRGPGSISTPSRARTARASPPRARASSMNGAVPGAARGRGGCSGPRVSVGMRLNSWKTMAMPARRASDGVASASSAGGQLEGSLRPAGARR